MPLCFISFKYSNFRKFSFFLPEVLWFQEKVENRIIIASWNDLHKLSIVIFRKKKQNHFELRHQKWSGDGAQNKTFKHIWLPEKGLIISSWPILFFITNFMKKELKFSEDF